MTRLALIEPRTLIGETVRNALVERAIAYRSVDLFTTDPEEVGAVTEIAGGAGLVQALDREALAQADVAVVCGGDLSPSTMEILAAAQRTIVIDPSSPIEDAAISVAGVSEPLPPAKRIVVSPHPAILLLSHLLAPLRPLAPRQLNAHVLMPASIHGQAGIDELFGQTRSILSMSDKRPEEVFGAQLAFNLLPWRGDSERWVSELTEILDSDMEIHIHPSQAGVFHCLTAGIHLGFAERPGLEDLRLRLVEEPTIEEVESPETLGPVFAASSERILLGEISPSGSSSFWLWSAVDNLTASAHNALALAFQ